MRHLRAFLIGFLLTVVAAVASYQFLDRPISFFAHNTLASIRVFSDLTHIPEIMAVVASLTFVVVGLYALLRWPLVKLPSVLLLCGISIGVASLIKDQLKFVFGRTWPETWLNNNPSLIRDGVSGFNFFHGGAAYSAFPSGHTAVTCAMAAVLWMSYPRYRPVWAAMVAAVVAGLIGANYHFVSDVIAGAFVGWSTGWIAVLLWDAGGLPRLAADQGTTRPPA